MAPVHGRQEPGLATGPRVVSELQNLAAALPDQSWKAFPQEHSSSMGPPQVPISSTLPSVTMTAP